ncbi:MAG: hypothetical protein ACYSTY_10295 [Planctomycetota bacterium]
MDHDADEAEAGRHRPAPRQLRRSSRTHWPLWRAGVWVVLELVVVALAVLLVVWLFARSSH